MQATSAVDCEVPLSSRLQPSVVSTAFFHDAYRAPLTVPPQSVTDIFLNVFGHHPAWMKAALIVRNRVASLYGLSVSKKEDILSPTRRHSYEVGDTIGPWPIFSISQNELIVGRDNSHLDFRLSVLREVSPAGASVVISTACYVHNRSGRIYLFFVVPFHRWGVKYILNRALRAGRL